MNPNIFSNRLCHQAAQWFRFRSCVVLLSAMCALSSSVAEPNQKAAAKEELVKADVYLGVDRLPAGGTCPIAIVIEVKKGWHINANPPKPDYVRATKLKLKSKLGSEIEGNFTYPKGTMMTFKGFDEPVSAYENKVIIRGILKIPEAAAGRSEEIDVVVEYQACNDEECMAPAKVALKGTMDVARKGETVMSVNEKLFK